MLWGRCEAQRQEPVTSCPSSQPGQYLAGKGHRSLLSIYKAADGCNTYLRAYPHKTAAWLISVSISTSPVEAEPQAYESCIKNAAVAAAESSAEPPRYVPGVCAPLLPLVTALPSLPASGPMQSLPEPVLPKGSRLTALPAGTVCIAKLNSYMKTYILSAIQKNIQTTCPRLQKAPQLRQELVLHIPPEALASGARSSFPFASIIPQWDFKGLPFLPALSLTETGNLTSQAAP